MSTCTDRKFSPALEGEIRFKIETSADSVEDGEEVKTRAEVLRELMEDMDYPEHVASEFKRELEGFGIEIGVFREITKEEMSRIFVIGGDRKKYSFKRGGKFYKFETWKPMENA